RASLGPQRQPQDPVQPHRARGMASHQRFQRAQCSFDRTAYAPGGDRVTRPDRRMALDYVLITPARNEAAFIAKTLESVVAQTVLPKRWVVVSDGSTDGTDEIVTKYQPGREWLE